MKTSTKIRTRGRVFKGIVKSAKAQKTVTVEWTRRVYIPKYERYMKKNSKVKAHVPEGLAVKEGDFVIIKECRPISKTKKFIVTEVVSEK